MEMQARAPRGWSVRVDPTGVASVRASAFLDNLVVARRLALERISANVKGGNEDTVAMGAVGGENAEEAFERAVVSELRAAEAVEAMEAFADREEERRRG